jgi:hypothetical protein
LAVPNKGLEAETAGKPVFNIGRIPARQSQLADIRAILAGRQKRQGVAAVSRPSKYLKYNDIFNRPAGPLLAHSCHGVYFEGPVVVSVSFDTAAGASLTAQPKPVRPDPSTSVGADSFASLIDSTSSTDMYSSPTPALQPAPPPQAPASSQPQSQTSSSSNSTTSDTQTSSNSDNAASPGQQSNANASGSNPSGNGGAASPTTNRPASHPASPPMTRRHSRLTLPHKTQLLRLRLRRRLRSQQRS